MNVFVAYASEQVDLATRIAYALRDEGDTVFFDRTSLPPGESFDGRIRDAIGECHLFVFLVSPEAIAPGSYTLTELSLAERAWDRKGIMVLSVMAAPTDLAEAPAFLRTLTVLKPEGDLAAGTLAAIAEMRGEDVWVSSNIAGAIWTIEFHLPDERPRAVFYRFADEPNFRGTGISLVADRRGVAAANLHASISPPQGTRELLVKYVDARGRERGPFSLRFDAEEQFIACAKRQLDCARAYWVILSLQRGKLYASFAAILFWKNALREIRFSSDSDSVSRCFNFARDAQPGMAEFTGEERYMITISTETRYVAVQLVFLDGTESAIERFTAP